ncbi:MAG: ribosome maturation factor RimP [Betaproteobacteria bacterium RBG_16_66_20]|nr:MAG: ribosome maturation factor RimP [Betaproteobacteria bacterium RBG_16_66_20]
MAAMAEVVESTLAGMGFELVDVQASGGGGLLRIFIDRPEGSNAGITVDDCAEVSRQLTRVFAVEGIDYGRLEVSSPGLDRPLRKAADFARFAGSKVEVRMRLPDASGRRRFTGVLRGAEGGVATVEVEGRDVALNVDDIERARLVPNV